MHATITSDAASPPAAALSALNVRSRPTAAPRGWLPTARKYPSGSPRETVWPRTVDNYAERLSHPPHEHHANAHSSRRTTPGPADLRAGTQVAGVAIPRVGDWREPAWLPGGLDKSPISGTKQPLREGGNAVRSQKPLQSHQSQPVLGSLTLDRERLTILCRTRERARTEPKRQEPTGATSSDRAAVPPECRRP